MKVWLDIDDNKVPQLHFSGWDTPAGKGVPVSIVRERMDELAEAFRKGRMILEEAGQAKLFSDEDSNIPEYVYTPERPTRQPQDKPGPMPDGHSHREFK